MMLHDVKFIRIENCSIRDTNIHITSEMEVFGAVNINNAHYISTKNVTFQNNAITGEPVAASLFTHIIKRKAKNNEGIGTAALNVRSINDTVILVKNCIFISRVSGRGNRIGPVCVSVCLSVCLSALSWLNRLTY